MPRPTARARAWTAPLPLTLIRNADNRGFAAACNQGAAGSEADFLLFLNPDTRLMPGSLERPARYLGSPHHEAVGIVGIQLLDADGQVARNTARAPTARIDDRQQPRARPAAASVVPAAFRQPNGRMTRPARSIR